MLSDEQIFQFSKPLQKLYAPHKRRHTGNYDGRGVNSIKSLLCLENAVIPPPYDHGRCAQAINPFVRKMLFTFQDV